LNNSVLYTLSGRSPLTLTQKQPVVNLKLEDEKVYTISVNAGSGVSSPFTLETPGCPCMPCHLKCILLIDIKHSFCPASSSNPVWIWIVVVVAVGEAFVIILLTVCIRTKRKK
jgi:hypothetical protein